MILLEKVGSDHALQTYALCFANNARYSKICTNAPLFSAQNSENRWRSSQIENSQFESQSTNETDNHDHLKIYLFFCCVFSFGSRKSILIFILVCIMHI